MPERREIADGGVTFGRTRTALAAPLAIAPLALALFATSRWIWALWANRDRGLDVSDEAYYLLAASRPSASTATTSDFGFYLRPLLSLAGGSIAWFRVVGFVTLVVASVLVAAAIAGPVAAALSSRARRFALVAGMSVLVLASMFTYYGLWLPTPSYNLLTLVFMLLTAACLIVAGRAVPTSACRPMSARVVAAQWWPVAALGAVLVCGLTVKAPSFLAATVLCTCCIAVLAGRQTPIALLAMLGGSVVGLGVHWGLVADAPLTDLRRLMRGREVLERLRSHSAREIWETDFLRQTVVPWMMWFALGALVLLLTWRRVRLPRERLAVLAVASCLSFVLLWNDTPGGGPASVSDATGWWWLRAGTLTLLWTTAAAPHRHRTLIVGPTIVLLAVASSIGTNNGFIRQFGVTSGLMAVAVLAQLGVVAMMHRPPTRPLVTIPAALYLLLASTASVHALDGALDVPYRLGSVLADSDQRVDLGAFGTISVSAETASYISQLQSMAAQLTDEQRTCLVDLTGGTPVAAIALNARPAGSHWLIGGYPGSAEAAAYSLGLDPCTDGPLAVLEAPQGERAIRRPAWLAGRELRRVGEARFQGYLVENQVLWVSVE